MTILFTSGSTTTVSTERNLFDIESDLHYATWIFTHNMQAGDKVTIKVYARDFQSGNVMRIYFREDLVNAQLRTAFYIPWISTRQYRVSIQRILGTDRVFSWLRGEITSA